MASSELANLSAPEHPLPGKPLSQIERPLPCGRLLAEKELRWRALYSSDPKQKRAALRIVHIPANPEKLPEYINEIEKADDKSVLPPVLMLEDPRVIPSLRRALGRMKDAVHRDAVLHSLYASGDWNHSADLIDLFRNTPQAMPALTLLGVYHPEVASAMSLEILGMTKEQRYLSPGKNVGGRGAELAFEILEQNKFPDYKQLLISYFQRWPAPIVAGKLGDYRLTEAEPLIRSAAENADKSPYFNTFTCQKFYRYALARFGDQASMDWMLSQARMLLDAPAPSDYAAYLAWGKQHGEITGADIGPFCNLLVKLGTPESLQAYVALLTKENSQAVQTSISPASFLLGEDSAVVDALDKYLKSDTTAGLTEAKKALALHSDNPKAASLFQEYVPDSDERDDLVSLANEFGLDGLYLQPAFSSFHKPIK